MEDGRRKVWARQGQWPVRVPDGRRIRMLIAYRGAGFHGWQQQEGLRTVEGVLTEAVVALSDGPRKVWGASRTDAGVHARGQVAVFDHDGSRPVEVWYRALNARMPEDVSVVAVDEVPGLFHPRHDARGKRYRYTIREGFHGDPFEVGRSLHVPWRLDVEAMHAGAQALVGEHDFSAFRAAGCDASSPVRRLYEASVWRDAEDRVVVQVTGSAFLKYMVRIVVGTLLRVGQGRRPSSWVGEVLASRDRRMAGATVEPSGLVLERIFHPDQPWGAGTVGRKPL